MNWIANLLLFLLLWLGGDALYLACNHGLAPNARLQQLLRYLAASACAVAPLVLTQTSPLQPALLLVLAVAALWMVTYPLTYHLTHRKAAPDYDHQIDIAFGIYLVGWLTGAMVLLPAWGALWGILMFALAFVPVAEWVYYAACHAVIDANGMKIVQETNYNEVIEFFHSYPLWRVLAVAAMLTLAAAACIGIPILWPVGRGATEVWRLALVTALTLFETVYLWKTRHGLFIRTGIAELFQEVRTYVANNRDYTLQQQQRLATLDVTPLHPSAAETHAHTVVLVIGESASRDYMSAFTPVDVETTPWMSELKRDERHCLLFPHAYSCDIQTVPTLERALTEYNQYDGGAFYSSCSIVDVAHSLGYRVHWYSNQGTLGAADTPITLVAETADVARWTLQRLNQEQYDESLLDFLDEVDPAQKNLVVLHLIGSHFNYENRFPAHCRQWGSPGNHDRVVNYKNTLHYTDSVLHRIFDYAHERLNLSAMLYCSDHADVPDRRRMPNFGGFLDTHIPLMCWLSEEYISRHPERTAALRKNQQSYWTNDLLYELFCGIMDIRSNRFREENSLASDSYRFTREDLTVMRGTIRIAEDTYDTYDKTST